MAYTSITQDTEGRKRLKSYFQRGDTPTEANFAELIDLLATVSELKSEEALRAAADNDLQNQINTEKQRISALNSLTGMPSGSTKLGSFTGGIISDQSDIYTALQAIETYAESTRSQLQSNDDDIADLRTDLNAEISATNTDITNLTNNLNSEIANVTSNLNTEISNLTSNLNSEIATTNTEIAAHDTRISTLEATTILDSFIFACSSETGDIGTGVKSTFRMPYGFTCTEVRASLVTNTASSPVELKVLVDGTAITDTVQIAAGSTTTYQAGVPSTFLIGQNSAPVSITMDSEVEVNVLAAPTGASGLKVTLVGYVGTCSISVQGGTIAFPITFPLGTVNTLITCTG